MGRRTTGRDRRRVRGCLRVTIAATLGLVVGLLPVEAGADPIGPDDVPDEVDPTVPSVSIDWTMPDRYDLSPSTEIHDEVAPQPWNDVDFREYLRPETWQVDLDGTISNPANFPAGPYEWSWKLEGPGLDEPLTSDAETPSFEVPELGTYQATVEVTSGSSTITGSRDVVVDDLLIAVAGDSLVSGEGNPDDPGELKPDWAEPFIELLEASSPGAYTPTVEDAAELLDITDPTLWPEISRWVDPDCDRSKLSGAAKAAKDLEERDPRTSVTYVNVACTGAWTTSLVDLPHPGVLGDGVTHPPQLNDLAAALCHGAPDDQLTADGPGSPYAGNGTPDATTERAAFDLATNEDGEELVGTFGYDCTDEDTDRAIDALVFSAGINDIGFREILLECADLNLSDDPVSALGWIDEFLLSGLTTDLLDLLAPGWIPGVGGCDESDSLQELLEEGIAGAERTLARVAAEIEDSGLVDGPVLHVQYPTAGVASVQRISDTPGTVPGSSSACADTALARISTDAELFFLLGVNESLNDALVDIDTPAGFAVTPSGVNAADSRAWWAQRGYCSGAQSGGEVLDADRDGFSDLTGQPVKAFRTLLESVEMYNNELGSTPCDSCDKEYPVTFGVLHPNAVGHERMRADVYDELVARLRPITDEVRIRLDSITIEDSAVFAEPGPSTTQGGVFRAARISPDEDPGVDLAAYRFSGPDSEVVHEVDLNWTEVDGGWATNVVEQPIRGPDGEAITFDLSLSDVVEPDGGREYLRLTYPLVVPAGQGEKFCFETPVVPDPGPFATSAGFVAAAAPIGPGPGGGGGGGVECIEVLGGTRSVDFDTLFPLPLTSSYENPDVNPPFTFSGPGGFGVRPGTYRLHSETEGGATAGGFDAILEFSVFAPEEPLPTADAGGPYVADEAVGSAFTLDATASTTAAGDADPDALTYEWSGPLVDELGGDEFDWDQPVVSLPADDDLGPLDVTLTVTEGDRSHTDTTTVTVRNVAPTGTATITAGDDDLDPDGDGTTTAVDEGTEVTITIDCADPGADTQSVAVQWWDDLDDSTEDATVVAGPDEQVCPPGGATSSFDFDYLDDSGLDPDTTFPVTVRIVDDDGGTGSSGWELDVANVAPTLVLDAPTTAFPAGDAVLRRPDQGTELSAALSDPGSEDLTLDWAGGAQVTTSTNPSGAEPAGAPSPGPTAPSSATDTYGAGPFPTGVTTIDVVGSDDDGSTAGGEVVVLTTADLERSGGVGWWRRELERRSDRLDDAELQGALDVISWASTVFDDLDPATARAVLDLPDARAGLLLAWLEVASGVSSWSEPYGPSTVGAVIGYVEALLGHHGP